MSNNERLTKCDFCSCRNEYGNCRGEVGSEACDTAGWRFMEYMKALANNNHTNNVNINRNSRSNNYNHNYNNRNKRR